ncbi:MAG: hypothetical protein IH845_04465 [Nanoarchaeota archaeon]|nr:hypothetical protein [Nanoarchaeota archaeon]
MPTPKFHFSGKSSPEIFVGRIGYPNINHGILAPSENDNLSNFATAEDWSKNNFSIENILRIRGGLVHGKTKTNIKSTSKIKKISEILTLSSRPVSTEFFLKKKPSLEFITSSIFRPMTNPAPLQKVVLEENPKVEKKVDYITSDTSVLANNAIKELYDSKISVDHLQKLLSIGLLGKKSSRKMVPTAWSITATDDIVSIELLNKIKYYKEENEIKLFSGVFVGNYIEILVLPGAFSFEAIEVWGDESVPLESSKFYQDYESFHGRKVYAKNITGGYYAMRLGATEYLGRTKRQAKILSFRLITKDYYAPLGVGVVREVARRAFNSPPKIFDSIDEALKEMENKLGIKAQKIKQKSWTLNHEIKQKSLRNFF